MTHTRRCSDFLWQLMRALGCCAVLLVCLNVPALGQVHSAEFPRELTIGGQAEGVLATDTVIVTAQYSGEGRTAALAQQQVQASITTLERKLQSAAISTTQRLRGESVAGASGQVLTPGSLVKLTRAIALTLNTSSGIAPIVDAVLETNGSIIEIEYQTSEANDQKQRLIAAASKDAAEKAAFTAQQLGVSLGKLLSVSIAEEPLGALRLEARQLGASSMKYDAQPIRILASLRYEIIDSSQGN